MINRLFYRLKYTAQSIMLGGVLLLFFAEWRSYGIYSIIIGFLLYLISVITQNRTEEKHTYDADENGNAKPNHR